MSTDCPTDALGRSECGETLRTLMATLAAARGEPLEITVSTLPPLVSSPYGEHPYECKHGVTYWIEPTSEQIADWAARGVR